MKKTGVVFILITLLLSAAAMLLRKRELAVVLDGDGLAVFRWETAAVIGLSVLAAVIILFIACRFGKKAGDKPIFAEDFAGLGLPGVLLAALCLLAQLYGAWLLFRTWKTGKETLYLILAVMAGLGGAGRFCLRLEAWKARSGKGARLLAGSLVTLFYCFWLIVYYRYEAPNPSLILTVYAFLALCACSLGAYSVTGGAVGRLKPRQAILFCGLGVYLSLVALVGEELPAYRFFWGAAAVQFACSALTLLSPLDRPAPEAEPAQEEGPPAEEGEASVPEEAEEE